MSSQTRCSAPKTGPSDAPFAMLSAQRWCDEVVNSAPHSRPQPPRTGVPISGPRGRMEPFPDMRRNRRCGVGQDGRPSRQCEASDNGGNAGIGAPRDRMSRHPAPAAGWSPSRQRVEAGTGHPWPVPASTLCREGRCGVARTAGSSVVAEGLAMAEASTLASSGQESRHPAPAAGWSRLRTCAAIGVAESARKASPRISRSLLTMA